MFYNKLGKKVGVKGFYQEQIADQRQWIENCEKSSKSYTGPNGQAIREADDFELHRLLAKLEVIESRERK